MEKAKSIGKLGLLGVQNLVLCFGATVLVPILLGINIGIALISAGIGTLIFHCCTQFKVPVFLGSSFAFLPALTSAIAVYGVNAAMGGVIAAGAIYLIFAFLIWKIGVKKILSFFPPIVTGPIIILIGTILIPSSITTIKTQIGNINPNLNWLVMLVTVAIAAIVMAKGKGLLQLIPILFAIPGGYLFAALLGMVDISTIGTAVWFGLPEITWPNFNLGAILAIAPIAIATFVEHIGDIEAVSNIANQDFVSKPGLHRTIAGDGLATMFAGIIGGPPNTTYSEGTGGMAITKNYDPRTFRLAACLAILLGFCGKFVALLQTIPGPVMGGVSFLIFGSISCMGFKTLVTHKIDFSQSRNIVIVALMLGFGLVSSGGIVIGSLDISGVALAAIVGIILNKIWPEKKKV